MSGCGIPGPVCGSNASPIDDGTLMRWWSPPPGPVCKANESPAARHWHSYCRTGGFAASTLTMSPLAVTLLQAIETLRLKPYDDQTSDEISAWVKGATIGYGHLIASGEWSTYKGGVNATQAEDLFKADTAPYERTVGQTISVGVQQYEFDAMVILAFNIGHTGFRESSVARLVNDPSLTTQHTTLEAAWKAWNKSQGKVNRGLVNRRVAEWRIYTSGIYARW